MKAMNAGSNGYVLTSNDVQIAVANAGELDFHGDIGRNFRCSNV